MRETNTMCTPRLDSLPSSSSVSLTRRRLHHFLTSPFKRQPANDTVSTSRADDRVRAASHDRVRANSETAKALDVGSNVYVLRRGKSSDAPLEVCTEERNTDTALRASTLRSLCVVWQKRA